MKKTIILLLVSLFPVWLLSQNLQSLDVLRSANLKVEANINLAEERLNITKNEARSGELISKISLSTKNGEIVLSYTLAEMSGNAQYYEVIPEFIMNGEKVRMNFHEELRGDWGNQINPGAREITWINVLDRYINLDGSLELNMKVNLLGQKILPYDCSKGEPTFTAKQRRHYLLAAGVGVLSIGAGQLFKSQSDDVYDNEYLTSSTLTEAQPRYDDANSKHQTYLVLTYAGTAILLTDAVLYLIRQNKYKRDLRLYNQWCKGGVSIAPAVRFSFPQNPTGMTGLKLKFSF